MVRQMTLAAILGLLHIMGVGCRLSMTGGAGYLGVRGGLMGGLIDQGDEFFRNGLRPGPSFSVTVEAEVVDSFDLFGTLFRHGMVAGHARGIFLRKGRKGLAGIVTGAALIRNGFFRIEPSAVRLADAALIMGIVAAQTVLVLIGGFDLQGAMFPALKIVHDGVVARQALIPLEKIPCAPGHISRIGVEILFSDVFVTLLAGSLTVCRGMKTRRIDHPRGPDRWEIDEEQTHHPHQKAHSPDTHPCPSSPVFTPHYHSTALNFFNNSPIPESPNPSIPQFQNPPIPESLNPSIP
jgi:hypothetical protein